MALIPDQPFPKTRGNVIRSKDWNDAITEVQRLDTAKVNKAGDAVTGSLTVSGNAGVGTTNPQFGRLTIEDAAVPLSLRETGQSPTAGGLWRMPLDAGTLRFDVNTAAGANFSTIATPLAMTAAGNVGIATATPNDRLDVAGNLRILTGSNPIRFTGGWSGFPDTATNQAEISNDTGTYKTLMIIGNRSAGLTAPGGGRRVSVWDVLEVNGNLRMNADLDILFRTGNDPNHGIGWYGPYPGGYGKSFAGSLPDGPVVYGFSGGALGSTSGAQRIALFWNNSGNVGLGRVASTSDRLDIQGNTMLRGSLRFPNAATPMMFIYESGFNNPQRAVAAHSQAFPDTGLFYRDSDDTMLFQFAVGPPPALAINLGGNVGIRVSNPSFALHVNGDAAKTTGGGSWTIVSDERLKKSINRLSGALGKLSELRGVSFEWKKPEEHGDLTGTQMGLVAQEVEKVFPEWVDTDLNGRKTLTTRGFEALVVEAFKELKAENEALKTKYKELEARLKALEQAISGGAADEGPGDVAVIEATQAAERRARELGVRLSDVEGTGFGGRILVVDVEKAAQG